MASEAASWNDVLQLMAVIGFTTLMVGAVLFIAYWINDRF